MFRLPGRPVRHPVQHPSLLQVPRTERAADTTLDAQLAQRGGIAALVHEALTSRRWALQCAQRREGYNEPTLQVVLAHHDRQDSAEIAVVMRLPAEQPDSELILARTTDDAYTTRIDTVQRWLSADSPYG